MFALNSRLLLAPFVFALACGNAEPSVPAQAREGPPQQAEPQEAAAVETAPSEASNAAAPNAEGDDTACVRAEPCCRAFIEAIGDQAEANRARAACESLSMVEGLGGAANDACANAIAGWRQALITHEREVPAACAASAE